MNETILSTDVLVIGAGGAATRAALEASNQGVRVIVVDKGKFGDSGSSPLCLQGIAAPIVAGDSPESFYEDWIRVGQGMSDQNLVWECVTGAAANIIQMLEWGVDFVKDTNGRYWLYRGAGHSVPRGLTAEYKERKTNLIRIYTKQIKRSAIKVLDGVLITKLLKKDNAVRGAVGISLKGDLYLIRAKSVVLACGGANRIYACIPEWIRSEKYRTTGDAYKLAFDAGASIIDLEYPNFRETPPGASRVGGIYLNAERERFMQRYDPVALEKAPRQLMVAAIFSELQAGRGPIYWHIDKKLLAKDAVFASVFKNKDKIEIGIDFQRLLGGARINERAQTDVPHLFAAGESAGGLHGADRMQANGFLGTQIFGARAGYYAAKLAEETAEADIDMAQVDEEESRIKKISGNIDPKKIIKTIQETMWEFAGVVRDADGLSNALNVFQGLKNNQIPKISGENPFYSLEAMNLLFAAQMITTAALSREESRGGHRRRDYPRKNDKLWKKHIAVVNKEGKMAITELPVKTLKKRFGK